VLACVELECVGCLLPELFNCGCGYFGGLIAGCLYRWCFIELVRVHQWEWVCWDRVPGLLVNAHRDINSVIPEEIDIPVTESGSRLCWLTEIYVQIFGEFLGAAEGQHVGEYRG
jgi:hypothetical protein